MERYAWKATVLPGKLEEYIRRHNEIWPEMKDVMLMEMDPETGAQPLMKQVFFFN